MAVIAGTNGDDTITPGVVSIGVSGGVPDNTGPDDITGGDGNDSIDGGGRDDALSGEAGNDTLVGGGGFDSLYGAEGDDVLRVGVADTHWDILFGGAGNDVLYGADIAPAANIDQVVLISAPGNDTLYGFGSAVNRADYSWLDNRSEGSALRPILADLAAGTVAKQTGNSGDPPEIDTLVDVVFVRGTLGNDTFIGSAANETFMPVFGSDLIDGGGGSDTVSYAPNPIGVVVDLAAGTTTQLFPLASSVTDTLTSIENVTGSYYNDTLLGTAGANEFRPLSGYDLVDGRGGEDRVSYAEWWNRTNDVGQLAPGDAAFIGQPRTGQPFAGVTVNLALQVATDPWGYTDRLISIEHVSGTALADILTGAIRPGDAPSYLCGLLGNDLIRAERPGTGATADYAQDIAGVRVNLSDGDLRMRGEVVAGGTARDGWGDTDVLVTIDRVRGSDFADYLVGTRGSDVLDGGAGNDTILGVAPRGLADAGNLLLGGAGRDLLVSRGLGDTLDGGAGRDRFRLEGILQGQVLEVTIDRFESGRDVMQLFAADFGLAPGLDLAAAGRFDANAAGAATSAAGTGQFVFDTDDRVLIWDANGSAPGGARTLVTLVGGSDILASDIQLIG